MIKEDKELLLKDLSARLPYGVKAQVSGWDEEKGEVEISLRVYSVNTDGYIYFECNDYDVDYLAVDACFLYLRPMSSMTKEEEKEYNELYYDAPQFKDGWRDAKYLEGLHIDWLNKHHFDYRGLIEKGLAIEASEGMYGKEEIV